MATNDSNGGSIAEPFTCWAKDCNVQRYTEAGISDHYYTSHTHLHRIWTCPVADCDTKSLVSGPLSITESGQSDSPRIKSEITTNDIPPLIKREPSPDESSPSSLETLPFIKQEPLSPPSSPILSIPTLPPSARTPFTTRHEHSFQVHMSTYHPGLKLQCSLCLHERGTSFQYKGVTGLSHHQYDTVRSGHKASMGEKDEQGDVVLWRCRVCGTPTEEYKVFLNCMDGHVFGLG